MNEINLNQKEKVDSLSIPFSGLKLPTATINRDYALGNPSRPAGTIVSLLF